MKVIVKMLKWFVISTLALLGVLLTVYIVVAALGITVKLDLLTPAVETAVTAALDRKTKITGSVVLTPTLKPILEINGVQIDNPDGWTESLFAKIELARVQVALPALLKKQIDIGEIRCQGVSLNLETNTTGDNNWQFSQPTEKKEPSAPQEAKKSKPIRLHSFDKLSFKKIQITYRDNSLQEVLSLHLDELNGAARVGEPLQVTGKGRFIDRSYSFTLDGAALEEFQLTSQLYPLSLTGKVAGSPFTAKGVFGQEKNEPMLKLDSSIAKVDIGALLSWLRVAEDIDAKTDELTLEVNLQGKNMREIITKSTLNFGLKGGMMVLHGAGKGDGVPIAINKGAVSALVDTPVAINLVGAIDTTPITLDIKGMKLVDYALKPEKLPITIKAEAAGTVLDFYGQLALPVSNKNIQLTMGLAGQTLNSLNELFSLQLPPVGPYKLNAQFAMDENEYNLSDLTLELGKSRLAGKMRVDMADTQPRIEVELISSLLQIDDLALGDWGGGEVKSVDEDQKGGKAAEESVAEKTKEKVANDRQRVAPMLSQEALSRADAHVLLQMDKVLSGSDTIGSGKVEATLEQGEFCIDPLLLELVEGTAKTTFCYFPKAAESEIHLTSTVEKLDLGILAHRVKPESTMGGELSVDIALDARAPELDQLLASGSGHIDFAFAPVNFDAKIIDLWAVNLLSAMASEVDGEPTSVINCLVASFGMQDGLMQERTIFMDTTHMSIEGEASINFKTRELQLMAAPHAKRPEFFSLATPVKVSGKFDDFGIGINPIRLTGTVASFLTSPIHVPLRRIFSGKIPADGKKACQMAWENRNIEGGN